MQMFSFLPRDASTIEASVTIQCAVEEVFRFYRNFQNLPRFLGGVMAIEQIGPATSRWTIQGTLGIRAHWTIQVTKERPSELIRYETVASPGLRTYWEIHFAPGSGAGETEVREVDESTSRETRARGTCSDWEISSRRSVRKFAQIEGAHGNGKSD
jgi:uncharacterized membrane protein